MNRRLVIHILKKILKENEECLGYCEICPAKVFSMVFGDGYQAGCSQRIWFLFKEIGERNLIEKFKYLGCVNFQKEFLKLKEGKRKNIKI